MQVFLLITFLMLIFVGIIGGVIFIVFKAVDKGAIDKSEDPSIKTAQEFLPFEDIRDDMIVLSGHRYRAVLACTSTNYHLKTAGEKDQIELSFQRFLGTVSFPITFFLQTKVIDNSERLAKLKVETEKIAQDFPYISNYAEGYLEDMASLNERLGNNQQKKRYIIITYDDVEELSSLTEGEKIIHSSKEIRQRSNIIISNLESVGVNAYMMNTQELIELVYSSYYRDDYSYAEVVGKKECFSRFVHGETDKYKDITKTQLRNIILGETLSRLDISSADNDLQGKALKELLEKIRTCNDMGKIDQLSAEMPEIASPQPVVQEQVASPASPPKKKKGLFGLGKTKQAPPVVTEPQAPTPEPIKPPVVAEQSPVPTPKKAPPVAPKPSPVQPVSLTEDEDEFEYEE